MSQPTDPLILTLALDDTSFARFDALRRQHFPPALNRIPAHVTLFHNLPGDRELQVMADLAVLCSAQAPGPVRVAGLFPLGRGVAFRLETSGVEALRAELARRWTDALTAQDRRPWRPHVTIQNKVAPDLARDTLAQLQAGFSPWEARAEGLLLWRYKGGPWEPRSRVPFTGT